MLQGCNDASGVHCNWYSRGNRSALACQKVLYFGLELRLGFPLYQAVSSMVKLLLNIITFTPPFTHRFSLERVTLLLIHSDLGVADEVRRDLIAGFQSLYQILILQILEPELINCAN